MKIYRRFAILTVGMAAAACLFAQFRLNTLRQEHASLVSEANTLGILPGVDGSRSDRIEPPERETLPKHATARSRSIRETAVEDPALAFQQLAGLDAMGRLEGIEEIVSTAKNGPGQRTAVLVALREFLTTVHDPELAEEIRRAVFEAFARRLDPDSTDSMIAWISSAENTVPEQEAFVGGLAYFSTRGMTGRWIDWMAANLNRDQLAEPVAELVGEWTRQDYLAAGEWLASATPSPAKEIAIHAYVEAVASHDPQVAIQWAMTLPEGMARSAGLSAVHENWPLSDPEGKAAFQRDHNME